MDDCAFIGFLCSGSLKYLLALVGDCDILLTGLYMNVGAVFVWSRVRSHNSVFDFLLHYGNRVLESC